MRFGLRSTLLGASAGTSSGPSAGGAGSSVFVSALAPIDFLLSAEGEERRLLLWRNIDMLRNQLAVKSTDGGSAIVPLIVSDEHAALDLSSALQTERFFVPAIRYPTVAKGTARLRITVTAAHEEDQIRSLAEAIKRLAQRK